jgi:hypothetical protein
MVLQLTYAKAAIKAVSLATLHAIHFKELRQLIIIFAILTKVIVCSHHGAGVNEVDAAVLSTLEYAILAVTETVKLVEEAHYVDLYIIIFLAERHRIHVISARVEAP